jgi:hypothetical protein
VKDYTFVYIHTSGLSYKGILELRERHILCYALILQVIIIELQNLVVLSAEDY